MNVSKVVAGCAMVIAATYGTAIAEVPAGRIFVFHSTAQGGCRLLIGTS